MAFNAPAKIAENFIGVGKAKGSLTIFKMLILGILAGAYIGFGAELSTMVLTGTQTTMDRMSKLFGRGLQRRPHARRHRGSGTFHR